MTARPALTELEFQQQVVELARVCGWRTMHVRRSIGKGRRWTTATSVAGWPDLTIWRPGRLLLVELKTDSGTVSDEQADVLHSLTLAGVDARVWRPADWETDILPTLTAPRTRTQFQHQGATA